MDILRPPGRRAAGNREFQRAYKACLSCRQKKARCDLGGGANGIPAGPPCARCRREQRQCVFSEKRSWARTKKADSDRRESITSPDRTRSDRSTQLDISSSETSGIGNRTFGQDAAPSSIHNTSPPSQRSHGGPSAPTGLTSSMMRTVVSSGNDALNLLFEAAAHTNTQNSHLEPRDSRTQNDYRPAVRNIQASGTAVAVGTSPAAPAAVEISNPNRDVLNVWESCRFVKMGLFTAKEAITYVDLFFQNLSPLSPILTSFYSSHQNHRLLVTHEPVLCCTILMISSRYHVLPGIGGASRSFFIHHRLWQHCQNLIMRVILGQEKSSKCNTRTVGTIEALLLMSEWHPRSLHFPPESDGWDSDLTVTTPAETSDADCSSSSSNRWLEDVIEPARRSDRMSWMLLGSAFSLAHELGIFETEERGRSASTAEVEALAEQNKLRKQRVQQLLYVYINQLSSRIGCMSLMPQSLNHAIAGGLWTSPAAGDKSGGDEWLTFMESWMDLTKLTRSVNDMFFPSASFAKQQWLSGRYIGLLDHFRPLLNQWKQRHLESHALNTNFHNILFIEYHYVRVFTYSFGMQAVVERALADDNSNGDDIRPVNIDTIDYEFIQEVIDGCCQILKKVIDLAAADTLRFSPVRIFLRVTSSSIFLLKALSLGVRHAKLQESLDVLDRSIQALRSNILDDVHLASRYAMLLEVHVSRLRRNLVASCSKPAGMSMSVSHSHSHSTTRPSSTGPAPLQLQQPRSRTGNGEQQAEEQPSVTTFTAPSSSTNENNTNTTTTGISSRVVDDEEDWLFSLPFDPSMAPFGPGGGQFSGFEGGTLDFIWNLPG
ncbi:hypothetical protein VTN77DRAFT_3692 [Rasamsonia byssochlamydoides]|uniref:uncharacterized protein n=1 Tax=Rasamsonia byssochlamydoides TaxID=89139 RepID=UPI00374256A7